MYARHPLTQYTDILTDWEWRHFSAKLETAGEKPDNLSGKNVYDIFTSSLEIAIVMLSRDAGKEQSSTFNGGFINVLNISHETNPIDRPCPIKEHYHRLNECLSFWGANPDTRRMLARNKLCFTCLGQFTDCIQQCDKPVNKHLICKRCSSDNSREINFLFYTRGHS